MLQQTRPRTPRYDKLAPKCYKPARTGVSVPGMPTDDLLIAAGRIGVARAALSDAEHHLIAAARNTHGTERRNTLVQVAAALASLVDDLDQLTPIID